MTATPDARLDYLEQVSSIVLNFKPDKWGKMVGAEENLALFTEFFDRAEVSVLVLTLNPAGMIVPCLGFPASLKSKGVYFIKKRPENISKTNYKENLIYGDISPAPVDQLIVVVEEVGAPRQAAGRAQGLRRSDLGSLYFSDWPRAPLPRGRAQAPSMARGRRQP